MLKPQIKNKDDDQLYYTKAFLDKEIRDKLKIQLDYKSEIFINLNGGNGECFKIINRWLTGIDI